MVSLTRVRRSAAVPVVVCLLSAAGLLVLDALAVLPRPTVLRAGFSLVGAVVALVLFVASRETSSASTRALDPGRRLSPTLVTKGVVALSCGAVMAAARLNSRLVPLAVLLPIGLLMVALQLRGDPSVPAVLTQLGALFAAARLGKYVTTGFYFGGTDTFAHVAAVDALIEARYTAAIPHGYDLYPVFHFVVGAVEHVTGLPTYDALVLAGIVSMTLVVPIAYLLGWSVFGSTRLGLLAALSVTLLEFFSYHALYYYPQALASVLILVALYVNSQLRQTADQRTFRRLSVFVIALVATMVITHHLTYILFAGVAAVAVPIALIRPSLFGRAKPSAVGVFRYRWLFPGLVGAVFLLTYWAYSPSLITVGIVELTAGVLLDVATIPGGQLYTYGAPLPTDSVERAVEWLLTPTGMYASGLTALALLAGYELLAEFRSYRRGFTLAATGLVLSPLLLPLPVPIPQLERLKFVVTLVVLFPLSVGLKRALSADRRYVVVALLLVATLGGATAFTVLAADDMSETYIDEPREQVTMTDGEYGSVGTTAAFLREYGDGSAATDRVTNRAFETVSSNATRQLRARPPGLQADATYLVTRERWTDHVVALGDGLRSGELNTFTVSQARFERTDSMRDKVYTTAHVRVYRSDEDFRGVYGTNGTAR